MAQQPKRCGNPFSGPFSTQFRSLVSSLERFGLLPCSSLIPMMVFLLAKITLLFFFRVVVVVVCYNITTDDG